MNWKFWKRKPVEKPPRLVCVGGDVLEVKQFQCGWFVYRKRTIPDSYFFDYFPKLRRLCDDFTVAGESKETWIPLSGWDDKTVERWKWFQKHPDATIEDWEAEWSSRCLTIGGGAITENTVDTWVAIDINGNPHNTQQSETFVSITKDDLDKLDKRIVRALARIRKLEKRTQGGAA